MVRFRPITPTVALTLSLHIPIVAGAVVVPTTRRSSLVSVVSTMALMEQTHSSETPTPISCGDVLVPEIAVPGAYENACMTQPIRIVPLQSKESDSIQELKILQGSVGPGTTGAAVWNSGILLKRLLEQMNCWKGATVLELGCGTGLVSLAAKALGAKRVIATDGNSHVLARAAKSAKLNELEIETALLPWGLLEASDYSVEWVIGSDLTYSPGSWPVLADTFAAISTYRVLYLTLAHGGFSNEMDGFLTVAAARSGLVVDQEYTRKVRSILATQCLSDPEEVKLVQQGGGVNVVVLRRSSM